MTLKRYSGNIMQQAPTGGRPRILYVEDEDPNWEVAEARLRGKYELVRAKDATTAFKLLGEEKFDLILMDIQLQNSTYDGIEITKILRGHFDKLAPPEAARLKDTVSAPIIFVTAYTSRYSKDDLKKVGGDEVIAKPVDFTQLSLAITRLIARSLRA